MKQVTIVFPCYNEEENLEKLVKDWHTELENRKLDFELIVVDDCSRDASYALLKELAGKYPSLKVLKNAVNSRYGKTVYNGIKASQGEYILWTDSDYSHLPSDFWKLWDHKDQYDAVWGIRGLTQRDTRTRVFFTMGNISMTALLFQKIIKDPNCAFKLYKRKSLLPILESIDTDPLMTTTKIAIKSKQRKLKIREIPVQFLKRTAGNQSISHLPAAFKGIREMIKFRLTGR